MKVTVAMPAFNTAPYVEEAIDSVLSQDFRSFELIVVDDRSTDDTWRRIRALATRPKIRTFRNRRNLGPGATRNAITRLARGRYLVPCDADDLMLPNALQRLSAYLDQHPAIGAVYGDLLEISTDASDVVTAPPGVCGEDHRQTWDLLENVINHPGSMIRKRLIERVGGYDESVYSVDDWSLWLKLAEVAEIAYLPGELYYVWRRRPTSITQTDPNWHRDVLHIRNEAIRRRYGASDQRLNRHVQIERPVRRRGSRAV